MHALDLYVAMNQLLVQPQNHIVNISEIVAERLIPQFTKKNAFFKQGGTYECLKTINKPRTMHLSASSMGNGLFVAQITVRIDVQEVSPEFALPVWLLFQHSVLFKIDGRRIANQCGWTL